MFNIGIAGQMVLSGFLSLVFIGYSPLPGYIARPLVIVIAIVVGGLLGAFIGFLKYKFNVHEVVSTIMINYIISYVTGFFINSYFADPISRNSVVCSVASRLTITGLKWGTLRIAIPLGIIVALLCVFALHYVLNKTTVGFELRAVGSNRDGARYAGINENRAILIAMSLSGILAGLAGVTYFMGYFDNLVPKSLPGMGYDCIAVALLGNINPLGSIFASILVTIFQKGSTYMSSRMSVPVEIAQVITALLLLFSTCNYFIKWWAGNRLDSKMRTVKAEEERV
jgi:simple sugar transport system permease protein